MTDTVDELRRRLSEAASELRCGGSEADRALALIDECSRLASQVSSQVDTLARAAVEPLPDLPGQLPLPAAS